MTIFIITIKNKGRIRQSTKLLTKNEAKIKLLWIHNNAWSLPLINPC